MELDLSIIKLNKRKKCIQQICFLIKKKNDTLIRGKLLLDIWWINLLYLTLVLLVNKGCYRVPNMAGLIHRALSPNCYFLDRLQRILLVIDDFTASIKVHLNDSCKFGTSVVSSPADRKGRSFVKFLWPLITFRRYFTVYSWFINL